MKKLFSKDDAVEIYYALDLAGKKRLMRKVGIDGELLAKGGVTFTPKELDAIYWAVNDKRDGVLSGAYDDCPGQISEPKSQPSAWARHLGKIMEKLITLATAEGIPHEKTALHLTVCAACR
jgi:hypothetical protein